MSSGVPTNVFAENSLNPWNARSLQRKRSVESSQTSVVFIVDGEGADRTMLELVIRSMGWQTESFASAEDLLTEPAAPVPSCLLLNIAQCCNSMEIQKRLTAERPEMPFIVLSGVCDVRMAVKAIKAGAIEFIPKPFPHELLFEAIRQALQDSQAALVANTETRILKDCYSRLTPRERQVMALVVSGKLNKQVGGDLGISEITVKAHRGKMMQKMKADSLAQLVNMAVRLHLCVPGVRTSSDLAPSM